MLTLLSQLYPLLATLKSDRRGVTTLEYATIAAVTVAVTAVGMAAISGPLAALWASIAGDLAPG